MSKCIVQYYILKNGKEINTDTSIVDFSTINKEIDEKMEREKCAASSIGILGLIREILLDWKT